MQGNAGPFDTATGVISNFYIGSSPFGPNPYTHYSFNITPQVQSGGTFAIRFADVETNFFMNVGVDNVSIQTSGGPAPQALSGTSGNDVLVGASGADQLTGGAGQDFLTGGLGGDTFVFNLPFDGIDTITDRRYGLLGPDRRKRG
jgi:Ca2+-binding RTX toxin-like protein